MSNRIIKDTIAITVITLVAGLALGVVQDITADPIAKQEAQAKQDAYKAVFADADSFETVDVDADAMQSYLDENGYAAQSIDETMLAKDASGNELGYAFTVTTSEGYGGDIQFAMGIQDDGTLNGISILSIGETAGLGMRANTDAFKDQFKDYGEKSLHKLLDELNKINGLFWIRIMYCYPEEIYEDLIDSMIRNEKVCHYLDIPIQHSNDTMLKRMGRRTSHDDLVRIITHLRERIPDITLRTTLICGFPGETQEIHEELMQFINDMEFDRLGAFTYSPEEGTPAAAFEDQVDEELKKDWQADVMELQEEVIFDKNEEMKGRELYVFIEGQVEDDNAYVGRTYRDAPDVDGYIFINTDETLMTGDIVKVKVTGAYEYDLIGEICQ